MEFMAPEVLEVQQFAHGDGRNSEEFFDGRDWEEI
jgi:hypothetical protein